MDKCIGDTIMIFKHGKDFFAEDNKSLRSIDMGKRMEVAEGIKNAISNEAMDVRMPCQEVAKSLDGADEGGFERFMGENGAKELIDSFSSTLGQESEQFSVAREESP